MESCPVHWCALRAPDGCPLPRPLPLPHDCWPWRS